MRLSCPNCSTEYDVPDTALAKPGRSLRCGQCGHQWQNRWPEDPLAAAASTQALWTSPPAATVTDIPPLPPEPRLFGKPVDKAAEAEMKAAAQAEIVAHPEANTAAGLPLSGAFEDTPPAASNGFTDLMYAARKKSQTLEPDPAPEMELPAPVAKKPSRTPVVVLLLVLIVLALVFAQHSLIMRHVPATVGFFNALGLKAS